MTHYIPDYTDHLILLLIAAGGSRTSYLAGVLGITAPSVTQRKLKLESIGLVQPTNKKEKMSNRDYVLTDQGEKEVDLNHVVFQCRMLQMVRKSD